MNSNNTNTLIRKIATLAALVVALTTGSAFANTNTPTVQAVHHWQGYAVNPKPSQPATTVAVFTRGRGATAKPISPK